MKLIILRVLLFTCVPIGVFLLVKAISLLRKTFNGKLIVEVPFKTKKTAFEITSSGTYSIWQKGKLFQKTAANISKPVIFDEVSNREISVYTSVMSPKVNGFKDGRIEIFTFTADLGNYTMALAEGSIVPGVENQISGILPIEPVEEDKYFIQIREAQPFYFMILAIPLILVSLGLVICGMLFGLMPEKLI